MPEPVPPEVSAFYERGGEASRLERARNGLELERTCALSPGLFAGWVSGFAPGRGRGRHRPAARFS